jgi:hypothetical protein
MTPPFPWSRDLALLLAWGDDTEAEHLLAQLNRVQRAFGQPEYTMPEPLPTGLPELITCDAHIRSTVERDLRFTIEQQRHRKVA